MSVEVDNTHTPVRDSIVPILVIINGQSKTNIHTHTNIPIVGLCCSWSLSPHFLSILFFSQCPEYHEPSLAKKDRHPKKWAWVIAWQACVVKVRPILPSFQISTILTPNHTLHSTPSNVTDYSQSRRYSFTQVYDCRRQTVRPLAWYLAGKDRHGSSHLRKSGRDQASWCLMALGPSIIPIFIQLNLYKELQEISLPCYNFSFYSSKDMKTFGDMSEIKSHEL